MKTLHIWGDYPEGILINADEIESRIDCGGDGVLLVEGVTDAQKSALYKVFDEAYDKGRRLHNADDLEEFLGECRVKGAEIGWSNSYEDVRNVLAFDIVNQNFFNLADGLEVYVFEYWDGSNRHTVALTENLTETELEVSDSYVSLDEWDGRNSVTGGMGRHQRVYRILTEDKEKPEEPKYLIEAWSQWQGDLPTGRIVEEYGLRQHLEDLDRNVDEYMSEIKAL